MPDSFVWPEPRKSLRPEQQDLVTTELRKQYDDGSTIRALAEESGRSYGYGHRSLSHAGVTFRPRGGSTSSSGRPRDSGPQASR